MMENILFVIPPYSSYEDFINPPVNTKHVLKDDGKYYGNLVTDMPLGILSLSGFLKKHIKSVRIELVDFNVVLSEIGSFDFKSYEEFFSNYLYNYLKDNKFSIIGISALFSPSYFGMLDLAKVCRELFKKSIIIAGGSVASTMYLDIFRSTNNIDGLCYGEGELPLLELVKAKDKKKLLSEHTSWITQDKLQLNKTNFQHLFIENLDSIPPYDYELCEDKYFINPGFTSYGFKDKEAGFHVMTSRGCPFKCIFCASHKVHGRSMRYYSLERVEQDFLELKKVFGAKILIFQDDHLMGDKKRAYEIVKIIKKLDLKVVFQNSLALYALDKKMLLAMKEAGVDELVLSVESGSERVLKQVMKKPLDLKISKKVVEICRELEIYTYANILIGLPGETKEDIEDTRSFLKTLNANWYSMFTAKPLSGSEMYEICEDNNYFKGDYLGSDYRKAVVETEDFTAEYIQNMTYFLNLELNFIENSDYNLGNYQVALNAFNKVIKVKDDHAIAYYCAYRCYKKLNQEQNATEALEFVKKYSLLPMWAKYFKQFNINLDNV